MTDRIETPCPECTDGSNLDRRDFIRVAGVTALASAAVAVPSVARARRADQSPKPAESLIKELFSGLDAEQKKKVLFAFDDGPKTLPTRLGMYNAPARGVKIGSVYTKAQQELIDRIIRAMASGEEGYKCLSRNGTWDNSGALPNCGCAFFGEPTEKGGNYAWLFTGHHLTLRADGDFMDGAAWGGPMYYGHSPNGYVKGNVFNFQTRSVLELAKAFDEKQMAKAIVPGTPGELAPSVRLRKPGEAMPGLAGLGPKDLSKDQVALVAQVMRDLVAPYRKEDADEVMGIVKARGGLEKFNLAFYKDKDAKPTERWSFWRIEGPGFIWNYRVLPHVHCYVNIGPVPTA